MVAAEPLARPDLSIVLPARNEAASVGGIVAALRSLHPGAEIIVVNDASTDDTAAIAAAAGALVLSHPYSKGNGASIKTGARAARADIVVFMDADGQHEPQELSRLTAKLDEGFDMVVGARRREGHTNPWRRVANGIYNRFASAMVGHEVLDLTSGFRAVRRARFLEFMHMLPNGFSYPTTSTMAFFRSGYSVGFLHVDVRRCSGDSHINVLRDGLKFLLIIFRISTLYSPLKIFFPAAVLQFLLGICYYAYTFHTQDRFTNMSALLLTSSLNTFLIGLVSEQITTLIFKHDQGARSVAGNEHG